MATTEVGAVQTTRGRRGGRFSARKLAVLGVLALLSGATYGLGASPSFATHDGGQGECAVTEMGAFNDSERVSDPLGRQGLRIAFNAHCNPGGPSKLERSLGVTVDGTTVAFMGTTQTSGGGNERFSANELHLPVRAVSEVCVELDGSETCVPPSSSAAEQLA